MKPNVIIRMGAANWDARVRASDGSMTHMDFRKMDKKARSTFHRELMNAFRQTHK
jgi:hypothetical protein